MSKKARREEAIKKEKQKKMIIALCVAVLLVVGALLAFILNGQSQARVFAGGSQTVTLYRNGKFSARLSHNVQRNGTYTENTVGGMTTISFTSDGTIATGEITGDILTLPDEWDDGHGHGAKLPLTKGRK